MLVLGAGSVRQSLEMELGAIANVGAGASWSNDLELEAGTRS